MDYRIWRQAMSGWARSRGGDVVLLDSIDSTHTLAARLLVAAPRATEPGWIFALQQKAGRGRYGRQWVSPHGAGVYASCLLLVPQEKVPSLPQVVGVALCEGLESLGLECRLKWPNDLLLGGRKVGGILLQTRGAERTVGAVASFGVNYSHRQEDLPRADCVSLATAGAEPRVTLAELSQVLAARVEGELRAVVAGERSAETVLERYRQWSAHRLGDRLSVSIGSRVREGKFAGFAATGELRLRGEAGEELLSSGEVEA